VVEHTLYAGGVARSIRAAPTIAFSKKFEEAVSTIAALAAVVASSGTYMGQRGGRETKSWTEETTAMGRRDGLLP
jgi:hypothetical protein